ncbi:hypothetical protein HDV63DRAFT_364900 [Trichoderma sp. SZMC 28014]
MEYTEPGQTPQPLAQAIAPRQMGYQACKTDNVSLMMQALSRAASGETRDTVQRVLRTSLQDSLRNKAVKVQAYLLDNGADVSQVDPGLLFSDVYPYGKPSIEALEILVAHGWDIDSLHRRKKRPLLWFVVQFPDVVEWCLDHGAGLDLPGKVTPLLDGLGHTTLARISLLECAAGQGSVPTFKLLREKGAPFHRGVLHAAVERAVAYAPRFDDPSSNRSVSFNERLAMIRFLADEVGIDVRTEWWKEGRHGPTPLEYVANHTTAGVSDVKELVWLLLDRGADPSHTSVLKDSCKANDGTIFYKGPERSYPSPLEIAQESYGTLLKKTIEEWQDQQCNKTS